MTDRERDLRRRLARALRALRRIEQRVSERCEAARASCNEVTMLGHYAGAAGYAEEAAHIGIWRARGPGARL